MALRGILTDHTPIFLGYGGNDPGFMNFLSGELPPGQLRARPIWAYRVAAESRDRAAPSEGLPPGCPQAEYVNRFMTRHQGSGCPFRASTS
jgi:hypothetical protein